MLCLTNKQTKQIFLYFLNIKMSLRTALLRINSNDRTKTSASTSNFEVNYNNAPYLQQVKGIVLKHAGIFNSIYNINTYNNTFTYWDGTTNQSFSIEVGQYTYDTFKTTFEAAALAAGITMNLSLNEISNRLLITNTPNIWYLSKLDGNPIGDVLGITSTTPQSGSSVSSYQAQGILNLSGVPAVYIKSRTLANSAQFVNKKSNGDNIIAKIPLKTCWGATVHWESPDAILDEVNYHDNKSGTNIQSVEIEIVDGDGNNIDLNNGNVNLIFKIWY